jgi:hypothetical protein
MRKHRATKEEKVAKNMIQLVNDLELDLDMVGQYLGEQAPSVLYNRLDTVIDSARYEKEKLIEQYDKLRD